MTNELSRRARLERPGSEGETGTAAADDVESRLDELNARLDELEAGLQAVRGYVGSVRAVNDDVERRADAAVAAAERLEARLDAAAERTNADCRQRDGDGSDADGEGDGGADGEAARSTGRQHGETPSRRADTRRESATDGGVWDGGNELWPSPAVDARAERTAREATQARSEEAGPDCSGGESSVSSLGRRLRNVL